MNIEQSFLKCPKCYSTRRVGSICWGCDYVFPDKRNKYLIKNNKSNECGICKKKLGSKFLKKCSVCKVRICEDCQYYCKSYRKIEKENKPVKEILNENFFCEEHMTHFLNKYTYDFLLDVMFQNKVSGQRVENKTKFTNKWEFKGKNLSKIVNEINDERTVDYEDYFD